MKIKKAVSAAVAATMLLGTAAYAKDNIYAYNKFISTILGPQFGYCDFAGSFAGHESEYADANDFFSGLISAFYDDIDADGDNELVTVDSQSVTVYQVEESGVVFLGAAYHGLIANYGDSYANVFTLPKDMKKLVGIERYGKTANMYDMNIYELDPETNDLSEVFDIHREDNEDGVEEKVWASGKTYYSMTVGGGVTTTINPDGYADLTAAAMQALADIAPEAGVDADYLKARMTGGATDDQYKFSASGASEKTYIRATGLRFTDNPVVMFEDNSELETLKTTPMIITVTLDGEPLRFPIQDPVVINERTLVPARTIFEALGAEVMWSAEDGEKITIKNDTTTINMTINSDKFYVNGEEKILDVPAQVINDKTLVPIRAISESMGCSVEWVGETQTVVIKTAKSEPEDTTAVEKNENVPEQENTNPETVDTTVEPDGTDTQGEQENTENIENTEDTENTDNTDTPSEEDNASNT